MHKSKRHNPVEVAMFGQVVDTNYRQREALYEAEQHRLARAIRPRRSSFQPVRQRLGRWLVTVGTQLQDHPAGHMDVAEQH